MHLALALHSTHANEMQQFQIFYSQPGAYRERVGKGLHPCNINIQYEIILFSHRRMHAAITNETIMLDAWAPNQY